MDCRCAGVCPWLDCPAAHAPVHPIKPLIPPGAPWLRETLSGLTTALVLLPVHGTYGLIALGPLGPGYAATGFLLGVMAAVLANLLPVLAGDRGPLAAGPSAALSLMVPPLLLQLMAVPALKTVAATDSDGLAAGVDVGAVLSLMGLALALAGLLLWVLGRLHWGSVMRYVPYPVHSGFMLGVAVLMALAMLPHALGLPSGQGWRSVWPGAGAGPGGLQPLAPLVALASAAAVWAARRFRPPWPALLLGLLAGVLVHHALALGGAAALLGRELGLVALGGADGGLQFRLFDPGVWAALPALAWPLGQFALAAALTGAMQALMAQSVAASAALSSPQAAPRPASRPAPRPAPPPVPPARHSPGAGQRPTAGRSAADALLCGQGLGWLASGLLGLVPASVSISATAVSLSAGARGTLSRVVHGLGLLLLLGLGLGLLQHLPMAAVAGVFLVVAWDLVDPWTRRMLGRLLRLRLPGADAAQPLAVLGLVAAISVGVSLVAGVLVGSMVSVLLFVRAQVRPPVRRVLRGDQQPSRTLRPPAVAERLRTLARRIVRVELDGLLFFGTADAAARAIEQAAADADTVVLDCRLVREIDTSGARVLLQLAATLQRRGCRLMLAAVLPQARRTLRLLDTQGLLPAACFFADADQALDVAESRALQAAGVVADDQRPLPLSQTLLGQGLDEAGLLRLQSQLQPLLQALAVGQGEAVFRQGDPGDALYLVLSGQVAIVLPAPAGQVPQRLVSFAPGAVFGEIGLLRGQPRSADAVVERDAQLARLDAAALQQLAQQAPELHAHLLRTLALHLADRLGVLTLTMQALEDPAPPPPPPRPGAR